MQYRVYCHAGLQTREEDDEKLTSILGWMRENINAPDVIRRLDPGSGHRPDILSDDV